MSTLAGRKVRAEYRKSVKHCEHVQKKLKVAQNQVEENKTALLARNKELQNNMLDVDFQVDALAGVGSEFLDVKKKTMVLNCLNRAKANKLHTQKQVAALQLDVDYWLGDERRLKEQYIQSKSQTDMLFGRLAHLETSEVMSITQVETRYCTAPEPSLSPAR